MTTHIRHNKGVVDRNPISRLNVRSYSQEEIDRFVSKKPDIRKLLQSKKTASNHKKFPKTPLHYRMNKDALEYFKEYAKEVKDPKFYHITIRFDYRTMCSLSPNDRPDFAKAVYDVIWLRLHTKLGIKKPKKIKPEYNKYKDLPRIYSVLENRDRYGQPKHEHWHLVCAIHPKHHKKVNDLYWKSVASSPRSFLFYNQTYYYEEVVHPLEVTEIKVPTDQKGYAYWKDWSELETVLDYDNKQASKSRELFSCFSPIKEASNATTHPIRRAG